MKALQKMQMVQLLQKREAEHASIFHGADETLKKQLVAAVKQGSISDTDKVLDLATI